MHIVVKEKEPKETESIPIIREFLEVFRELPGLLPYREVEF